jgi:hypothetical protein
MIEGQYTCFSVNVHFGAGLYSRQNDYQCIILDRPTRCKSLLIYRCAISFPVPTLLGVFVGSGIREGWARHVEIYWDSRKKTPIVKKGPTTTSNATKLIYTSPICH